MFESFIKYQTKRVTLTDGRQPVANITDDGTCFINLTGERVYVWFDDMLVRKIGVFERAHYHVDTKEEVQNVGTVSHFGIVREYTVIDSHEFRTDLPEPQTIDGMPVFFIVPKEVLATQEAAGRSDLLAPAGGSEKTGADQVINYAFIRN